MRLRRTQSAGSSSSSLIFLGEKGKNPSAQIPSKGTQNSPAPLRKLAAALILSSLLVFMAALNLRASAIAAGEIPFGEYMTMSESVAYIG